MRLSRCDLCHIDLDRVSVRRGGQQLLQDVSMHIHCGQLTVLIGQNGAGKTTLIRALLGEIPHSGSIRHLDSAGRDLAHLTTGYVPQHLAFDPEMPLTVMDFLAASMTRRPVWTGVGSRVRARVLQALKEVSAEDLADRPLGRCSGGELQRVLLALALHPAPDLLVLDEPVSGVDRNGLKLFLDTVTRLKERKHIALLLVSHDLRLVREYADHVILLDKNVLAQGSPGEVFASPAFNQVFGAGTEAETEGAPDAAPARTVPSGKSAGDPRPDVSASRIVRLTSHRRDETSRTPAGPAPDRNPADEEGDGGSVPGVDGRTDPGSERESSASGIPSGQEVQN
ncbi:MAG: metal ABC transporter ATP-binding protein [Clostridia bacterium]|nr:metal ABC transporter ATP-binding protein [Clostridia bacterium]